MALELGALREALLHPGNPELAKAAAEEVAGYENRLTAIENRLGILVANTALLTVLALGVFWMTWNLHASIATLQATLTALAADVARVPR